MTFAVLIASWRNSHILNRDRADAEQFQTVRDVYAILSTVESRDAYDRLRQSRGRGTARWP